jgi:hypothetical protein
MGSPVSPSTQVQAALSKVAALRGVQAAAPQFAENFLSIRNSATAHLTIGALGAPLAPPQVGPLPAPGIKPPTPVFLAHSRPNWQLAMHCFYSGNIPMPSCGQPPTARFPWPDILTPMRRSICGLQTVGTSLQNWRMMPNTQA